MADQDGERTDTAPGGGLPAGAKPAWRVLVILALLWTGAIAIWLGVQDVAWPVSLTAQILGVFFVAAGAAALGGAVLLTARPGLLFPPGPEYDRNRIAYIAGAALAGCYITLTIVAHSFRYEQLKALLYGLLAALFLVVAGQTLPRAWPAITKSVKGVGITLGVLGALANFWYQSFYLPESSQVGIQYGLSVVSVTPSGGDRIVTLDLTMENQSPVTALMLGSMVTVAGLTFPGKSVIAAGNAPQDNIDKYAQDLTSPSPWTSPPNPNIGSSGNPAGTILTVMQPVNNASFMFTDDTLSREFEVVVPNRRFKSLDVELNVLYARTTRLTLGASLQPEITSINNCQDDERSSWFINQSALVRYTRGAQVLYSHWCASATDPFITWSIQGVGTTDTPKEEREIGNDIGIEHASRNEIFALPS